MTTRTPTGDSLTLALEALPYEPVWWRFSDWSGQRILAKTALPLLRDGKQGPYRLAGKHVSGDSQYRHWTIQLADGLTWSDGSAVTAADYQRTIRRLCRDRGNRFRALLCDLDGYAAFSRGESDGLGISCPAPDRLVCDLSQANRYFAHLLASCTVSPTHRHTPTLSAGPYRLSDSDAESYTLARNRFFTLDTSPNAIETLRYRWIPHDAIGGAFAQGRVDVSADTSLAYPFYAEAMRRADFFRRNDGMILLLAAAGRFLELPQAVRHSLSAACDRAALCRRLSGLPRIATSYCASARAPLIGAEAPPRHAAPIRVAYENFYPNRQVVDELQRQWSKWGWQLEPVREHYGQRRSGTHLRLEIRLSLKSTPLPLYRADLARGLLPALAMLEARRLYTRLIGTDAACDELFAGLDHLLQGHGIGIPLLTLPQGLFVRRDIDPDSIFRVGSFIRAC